MNLVRVKSTCINQILAWLRPPGYFRSVTLFSLFPGRPVRSIKDKDKNAGNLQKLAELVKEGLHGLSGVI